MSIIWDYQTDGDIDNTLDLVSLSTVFLCTIVFNNALLVLLIQYSGGFAAFVRAILAGFGITVFWGFIMFVVPDSLEQDTNGFLLCTSLLVGGWGFFFGGLLLAERYAPNIWCFRAGHVNPVALRMPSTLTALLLNVSWSINVLALYVYGHFSVSTSDSEQHIGNRWATVVAVCYIGVFPALFYMSALAQTRHWVEVLSVLSRTYTLQDFALHFTQCEYGDTLYETGTCDVFKGKLTKDGITHNVALKRYRLVTCEHRLYLVNLLVIFGGIFYYLL